MKVALAYDYLNQLGGGERVLEVLCEMFPDAPIYTILYDFQKTANSFTQRKIFTSFLDFPLARRNHRLFIPLMPAAIQSLHLDSKYDLIISATAGYGKGISYQPSTKHLCYCYSPLRYAWEPEFLTSKFQNTNMSRLMSFLAKPIINYLRRWDYKMAQRPDIILADSKFIAEKVEKYYKRKVPILHPPFNEKEFFFNPAIKRGNYFLAVGRLIHYKKFDLVVEAFNRLGWPLKIAGMGPEWGSIKKKIRSSKIEMLGFVPDKELCRLYSEARALVFPNIEDFGLVMVEAQACGAPVIAFGGGGALEIIENNKTGLFFYDQSADGLCQILRQFISREDRFDRKLINRSTQRFNLQNFKNVINSVILSLLCQLK